MGRGASQGSERVDQKAIKKKTRWSRFATDCRLCSPVAPKYIFFFATEKKSADGD
jgi:hypothetical protein